jgi:hypothetical protein
MSDWEEKRLTTKSAKSFDLEYGRPGPITTVDGRKALTETDDGRIIHAHGRRALISAEADEVLEQLARHPEKIPAFTAKLDAQGVSAEVKNWALAEIDRRMAHREGAADLGPLADALRGLVAEMRD